MALRDPLTFKGISSVNHDQYNENLLHGLIDWLKWASLQVGAYQNVDHTQSDGILGGDFSRLRMVKDPRYTDGQVWEGFRGDWVWESGVNCSPQPTVASGVIVGGTFYPTPSTSTAYEHYIDYPRGRIVFSTAISTSSVVKTNFSHRTINFVKANEKWFRELMFESYRIEASDYLQQGSGQWGQLSDIRSTLPVVGIEVASRRTYRPYQIGGGQWVDQNVFLYIMTSNEHERNQWLDILSFQNDRTIYLINRKRLKESGSYPPDIDYTGAPVANPIQYPRLVQPSGDGGFRWTNALLQNAVGHEMDAINGWLYRGVVQFTATVVLPYI